MAFLLQTVRQLAAAVVFTGALQAHEHDDVGDAAGEHQLAIGAAEQLGELVGDDLDDVLRRGQGVEHLGIKAALLRARHELLDHLEVDVSFEHGHAHLAHGGVDVVLGQAALAAQAKMPCRRSERLSNMSAASSCVSRMLTIFWIIADGRRAETFGR